MCVAHTWAAASLSSRENLALIAATVNTSTVAMPGDRARTVMCALA